MFSFNQWQKGQAAAEYVVLIPAAIMIAISAGMIAGFINESLGKTVDGLNGTGICLSEDPAPDNSNTGPTVAQVGPHTIRLTSNVYNPSTNQTTITYTVSSNADPSISHWMLGIPQSVYGDITSVVNENQYEFVTDPTTGTTGMKFDTGYESAGGGGNGGNNGNNGNDVEHGNNGVGNGEDPQPPGNPPVNDGEGSAPGNPGNQGGSGGNGNGNGGNGGGNGNGNGRGNANVNDGIVLASFRLTQSTTIDGVSRDITLLITGQYVFEPSEVSIKAGQNNYYGVISAPVRIDTNEEETQQECE